MHRVREELRRKPFACVCPFLRDRCTDDTIPRCALPNRPCVSFLRSRIRPTGALGFASSCRNATGHCACSAHCARSTHCARSEDSTWSAKCACGHCARSAGGARSCPRSDRSRDAERASISGTRNWHGNVAGCEQRRLARANCCSGERHVWHANRA